MEFCPYTLISIAVVGWGVNLLVSCMWVGGVIYSTVHLYDIKRGRLIIEHYIGVIGSKSIDALIIKCSP